MASYPGLDLSLCLQCSAIEPTLNIMTLPCDSTMLLGRPYSSTGGLI